jgi:1-acyl-sn-glycerol-3-phosphate acyltransferase
MALFIGLRERARALAWAVASSSSRIAEPSRHVAPVALPASQLWRVRPVAAADYFERTPLMSWFSRTFFNILPIARLKAQRTVNPIDAMLDALRAGDALILFPEGTRHLDGVMGPFKPGVAHLLEAMPGLPIVPALLVNMGRSLPKGEFLPVPFVCEIRIGAPISPTERVTR